MAEALISERLQPSMLDRLTDDAPDARAEPASARVVDMRQLRRIVLRDLEWLLNTTRHEALRDLSAYPHTARSVLNYGVPDFTGTTVTPTRANQMRTLLREAIIAFEPRIRPESLEVVLAERSGRPSQLAFDIRGELWAYPMPIELYVRTELDTATGDAMIEDRS